MSRTAFAKIVNSFAILGGCAELELSGMRFTSCDALFMTTGSRKVGFASAFDPHRA
jgi:hypothetical protein